MSAAEDSPVMVEIELGRLVLREDSMAAPQYIHLREVHGERSFPMIIGLSEAAEIQRIVTSTSTERPMTHQLLHDTIGQLGAHLARVDIVDVRQNTFFARLILQNESGETVATMDARPSDSIALALRAGCPLRVAETVLETVRTDKSQDSFGGDEAPPADPEIEPPAF